MKRLLFILLVSGVWLLVFPNSYAMVDSNENDLSDVWEKAFNSNQLFAPSFLPLDDADGDSVSNLDESLAGTDPKDGKPPDGFLQTEVIHSPAVYINGDNGPEVFTPEAFSISWVTVRGKRYTLLHSPDLSAGSWIPIGEQILGYGYGITIPVAPTQTGDGIPDKLFWRVAVGDLDSDGDGFNDYEEYALNTNPYIADRDGDGLPDEWEVAYDLDLLENFDEYLNSTSPILASSDGNDGANDYQEVLLGTDPNVFSDGGGGGGFISPTDPVEEATFRVGGDYASWRMEIKGMGPRDQRQLLAVSPQYNEWKDQPHKLRVNNQYEITMHHTGSRPQDDPPWYCWEAGMTSSSPTPLPLASLGSMLAPNSHDLIASFVSSSGSYGEFFMFGIGNRWLVDNREGVIAGHTHSLGVNRIEGEKAQAIPVAIRDNSEATGVDATSITADSGDPGYQDKYWIMAPSGDDPDGNECTNDMHFQIPLVPTAQMAISYPEGSPPPATPAATNVTLGTADAACSWHGESVTTTEEPVPTYKIGDDEVEVALPIHVKTMKNRTLKISVFPVRKSASSPAIAMPNKAALTAKLHRVFGYQLNAWAVEPDYKPEQVFDYDPDGNGVLNWPSETHNQLLAQCVDAQANLIVTLIGDVAYVVGDEVAAGSAVLNTKPVVVTTSKPYDLSILSNLTPIPEADVVDTTMHELGHRILGSGHPDQGDGKAPLEGTDRRRRLMASGGHRGYSAYSIVKKEWDEAEKWFTEEERRGRMTP